MILRWALHFASGNSLFSGSLLLLAIVLAVTFTRARKYRQTWRLGLVIAVALIFVSTTPFSWTAYVIWIGALILWLWIVCQKPGVEASAERRIRFASAPLILVTLVLNGFEAATIRPTGVTANHDTMYVIGDSITAGLNSDDVLWPTLLAESKDVRVVNLAQPGAMADSAMKQAEKVPAEAGGIVMIEIGGNDMLSGRTAADYGADLERLMKSVASPGRTLVLLELPLVPLHYQYGREQRRIASEHNALLISKREFARVLGRADGTLDGIHLSPSGQQLMAEIVWTHVGPLYCSASSAAAAH